MSDTEKRDAVLMHYRGFDHRKSAFKPSTAEYEMADRIVELEAAEAERDRLRSILASVRAVAQDELRWIDAQPILRALEETP